MPRADGLAPGRRQIPPATVRPIREATIQFDEEIVPLLGKEERLCASA